MQRITLWVLSNKLDLILILPGCPLSTRSLDSRSCDRPMGLSDPSLCYRPFPVATRRLRFPTPYLPSLLHRSCLAAEAPCCFPEVGSSSGWRTALAPALRVHSLRHRSTAASSGRRRLRLPSDHRRIPDRRHLAGCAAAAVVAAGVSDVAADAVAASGVARVAPSPGADCGAVVAEESAAVSVVAASVGAAVLVAEGIAVVSVSVVVVPQLVAAAVSLAVIFFVAIFLAPVLSILIVAVAAAVVAAVGIS